MAKDFKERTITINLSRAFEKPLTKRAIAATFALKAGVEKETRLHKVLISNKINEAIWANGRFSAPRRMTVKVVKEKDTARVMLPEEKYEAKSDKKKETKTVDKKEEEKKETPKEESKTTESKKPEAKKAETKKETAESSKKEAVKKE